MLAVGRVSGLVVAVVIGVVVVVVVAGDVVGAGELATGVEAGGVVVRVAAVPEPLLHDAAPMRSVARTATPRRRTAGGRVSVRVQAGEMVSVVFMDVTIALRGVGAHRPHPLRSVGSGAWLG